MKILLTHLSEMDIKLLQKNCPVVFIINQRTANTMDNSYSYTGIYKLNPNKKDKGYAYYWMIKLPVVYMHEGKKEIIEVQFLVDTGRPNSVSFEAKIINKYFKSKSVRIFNEQFPVEPSPHKYQEYSVLGVRFFQKTRSCLLSEPKAQIGHTFKLMSPDQFRFPQKSEISQAFHVSNNEKLIIKTNVLSVQKRQILSDAVPNVPAEIALDTGGGIFILNKEMKVHTPVYFYYEPGESRFTHGFVQVNMLGTRQVFLLERLFGQFRSDIIGPSMMSQLGFWFDGGTMTFGFYRND